MGWTLEGKGNFDWPQTFLKTDHVKGNKTGEIEDILEDLAAAKKLHDGIGNFPFAPNKGTASKAQSWGEDALEFFKGPALKKVIGSLKVIKVRAEKLPTVNKKLSKDAKASLKSITTAIDDIVSSVELAKITPQINAKMSALVEADREYVLKSLKNIFKSYKDCAARKHPEIGEAAQLIAQWDDNDPQAQQKIRNSVAVKLTDACRDMTQNLQNIVKATGYGADITGLEDRDKVTIPKVAKTLIPIANNTGGLTDGLDKAKLAMLVRTVKVNADLFDEIAKRIPS